MMKWTLMACGFVCVCGMCDDGAASTRPKELRILFVGNSYTGQIQGTLKRMLKTSPYKKSTLEFISPGGCTLARHAKNKRVLKTIKTGKWDVVVLQEQSQLPSFPESQSKSFYAGVKALVEAIRDAKAKPVLYSTWGRRDGDSRNVERNPDYETMQKYLTTAYERAAERNSMKVVVPVGEIWKNVRAKDPKLGRKLYKNDGSHPSSKGAYLASCAFFHHLFGSDLKDIRYKGTLTAQEAATIRAAVISTKRTSPPKKK